MRQAPLFVRGYDLYAWLLDRFEGVTAFPALSGGILDQARRLVEALTLALQGFDTMEYALAADRAASLLRLHLRLAEDKALLNQAQYRFALETLDDIGKQLGGWQKSLQGV